MVVQEALETMSWYSIFVEVSAFNEHRSVVFRRTSHNHFLRTSGDVFTSSFISQEQTSCFSDNVNTNFVPFQVSRITFSGNTDFLPLTIR